MRSLARYTLAAFLNNYLNDKNDFWVCPEGVAEGGRSTLSAGTVPGSSQTPLESYILLRRHLS